MGEFTDMMLDGTLCSQCGVFLEEDRYGKAEGFPRECRDCKKEDYLERVKRAKQRKNRRTK